MFGRKKDQASVSAEKAISLRKMLGCNKQEPRGSRLQQATFLDLLSTQSQAQLEQEMEEEIQQQAGRRACFPDEAVQSGHQTRFLPARKAVDVSGTPSRLIYGNRAEQRSVRREESKN